MRARVSAFTFMHAFVTGLHHLEQLGVGEGVLPPDDGHGLGAGMSVAIPTRWCHPGDPRAN